MRARSWAPMVLAVCCIIAFHQIVFVGMSSPLVQLITGPNAIRAHTMQLRELSAARRVQTPIQVGHGAAPSITTCELDFASQKARPWEYPMFKDLVKTCRNRKEVGFDQMRSRLREGSPVVEPTAFVFHESRCGSTLTANLLATIPNALLFSESSPPIQAIGACKHCSREDRIDILRTVMRAMGQTTEYDYMFFKFQSVLVLEMDLILEAFPNTPWIFVYRDPVEVMMSHMKSGSHAPCVRQQRSPTSHHIDVLGSKAEAKRASTEQFCAAHLAVLQRIALEHMSKENSRGVAVNHKQLPDFLLDEVLPKHFRVSISSDLRAEMITVSGQYSKARVPDREWKDDSKKKQDKASPQVQRWASEYMQSEYDRLVAMEPRLASPIAAVSAESTAALAPEAQAGVQRVRYTMDTVSKVVPNCPEVPPANYPQLFNLMEMLEAWSPDDPDPPAEHYDSLCHFDYQTQKARALKYRNAEVPFLVYNVPNVNQVVKKWTPEYLTKQFGTKGRRTEISKDNHFMYYTQGRRAKTPPGWEPPTTITRYSYADWYAMAKQADRSKMGPKETHYYFRAEGDQEKFIRDDLEIFKKEKSFFIVEPERHRGIHCRFGMRGVIAESHFDGGRNYIAMLKGRKRYILQPPEECKNIYLLQSGHPSARHTEINWGNPDLVKYPKFKNARAMEVVLSEGEVLYLPSYYLHHIIAIEYNIQCNCRSGIKGGRDQVRKCGF